MAKKKSAAARAAAAAATALNSEEADSVAATAGDATTTEGNNSRKNGNGDGDDDGDDDEEEEEELELLQVDLGDMVKLKQVLDETVAAAVLEHLPEDYAWDNCKLGIMFVACVFAMIAQFAPLPFPQSRPVLGVCGSLYFALSGVLQLIATFVDRDTILWTQRVTDRNRKPSVAPLKNQDLERYGVRVRSALPRFSEWFTVTLEFHVVPASKALKGGAATPPPGPPPAVSHTWSIGQFFDKEGYFDETGLTMEVDKLFGRFDQRKYDDVSAADNKKKKE